MSKLAYVLGKVRRYISPHTAYVFIGAKYYHCLYIVKFFFDELGTGAH